MNTSGKRIPNIDINYKISTVSGQTDATHLFSTCQVLYLNLIARLHRKVYLQNFNKLFRPTRYRGYYTAARVYLLVVKTIFYLFAALIRKILFSPLKDKLHIFKSPYNVLFII